MFVNDNIKNLQLQLDGLKINPSDVYTSVYYFQLLRICDEIPNYIKLYDPFATIFD